MSRETAILIALAAGRVLVHALTNGQYGFHRDELMYLDEGRHLDWGFVACPPLTPFLGRIALEIFGLSVPGVRLLPSLAQAVALVLTGWMARSLGGGRTAQILAGLAVGVAPISIGSGALFQYVSFDYLWWVLAAYCAVRLLASDDPRWWIGIGAAIGLGMETKYTMGFLAAAVAIGTLATGARRYLRSGWLWAGAALAIALFLPNLVWQARHHFISLDFLASIHARDVRIGRTDNFLLHQFLLGANPFSIPLWLAGLWFYFSRAGRRFRLLGWMYAVPLVLFAAAKGRDYYLAPAYPMLLAAGSVVAERWFAGLRPARAFLARAASYAALAAGGILMAAVILPVAPVNSAWWNVASAINGDLKEEIGWPELVDAVAGVRDSLPEADRMRTGILAGNFGEAGAINLYGPARGLPTVISGVNSYWLRGYPDPAPETLIVIGFSLASALRRFESCEVAGRITNRYGVMNEETREHPDILVCRKLRRPWPELWKGLLHFG